MQIRRIKKLILTITAILIITAFFLSLEMYKSYKITAGINYMKANIEKAFNADSSEADDKEYEYFSKFTQELARFLSDSESIKYTEKFLWDELGIVCDVVNTEAEYQGSVLNIRTMRFVKRFSGSLNGNYYYIQIWDTKGYLFKNIVYDDGIFLTDLNFVNDIDKLYLVFSGVCKIYNPNPIVFLSYQYNQDRLEETAASFPVKNNAPGFIIQDNINFNYEDTDGNWNVMFKENEVAVEKIPQNCFVENAFNEKNNLKFIISADGQSKLCLVFQIEIPIDYPQIKSKNDDIMQMQTDEQIFIIIQPISNGFRFSASMDEFSDDLPFQPTGAEQNPFFFQNMVSKVRYNSRFTFSGNKSLPNEVDLLLTEVLKFEQGTLYEIRIDYDEDFGSRNLYGWDRFQLGYFYVQTDKIIMIRGTNILDKIKSEEDIFKEGKIVCQQKEYKDTLSENEKGWHEYILADGNQREYHGYNTLTETGFYESFVWEEGKGLTEYKSGFGAEKDDIELQLITTEPDYELLYGRWKVLYPYTILPSAFNFNQFKSFRDYQSIFDDPLIKEFVEPYNGILIDKVIEFSDKSFLYDSTEILYNPEYEFIKMDGHIYDDPIFARYRPFTDFFKEFEMSSYYRFAANNYDITDEFEYTLRPSGFIISEDYLLCPIHDEWIFYILKRLP